MSRNPRNAFWLWLLFAGALALLAGRLGVVPEPSNLQPPRPAQRQTLPESEARLEPPVAKALERAQVVPSESVRQATLEKTGESPPSQTEETTRGIVVDTEGNPLAGVRVACGRHNENPPVISDAKGQFGFPWRRNSRITNLAGAPQGRKGACKGHALYGKLPGYASVTPTGHFSGDSSQVVMLRACEVTISVSDRAGLPVADAQLTLRVDRTQDVDHPIHAYPIVAAIMPPTFKAKTDDAGIAILESVWTDTRLSVQIQTGRSSLGATTLDGDDLVLDSAANAARERARGHIRITPQARPIWHAVLPSLRKVGGQVLNSAGRAVPGVRVELFGNRQSGVDRSRLALVVSDAQGEFRCSFRSGNLTGATLFAQHGERIESVTPPYRRRTTHTATLDLSAAQLSEDPQNLTLVLESLLSITGRVLCSEGETLTPLHVHAIPAGRSVEGEPKSIGAVCHSETGRFELKNLAAGTYDLQVVHPFHVSPDKATGFPARTWSFPNIPSGSGDIRLELPPNRAVKVTLVPPAFAQSAEVFIERISRPDSPTASAPARMHERSLGNWPLHAPTMLPQIFFDGSQTAGSLDQDIGLRLKDNQPHALSPLEPGTYVFGMLIPGHFPIATAPLRFAPGSYEVEFTPPKRARLTGRVTGIPSHLELCAGLRDSHGTAIPLLRSPLDRRAAEFTVPLDPSGAFHLPIVPAAHLTLLLGTAEALSTGSGQRTEPLDCRAGGEYEFSIAW